VRATAHDARVTELELELTVWRWTWQPRASLLPRIAAAPFPYTAGQYLMLSVPALSDFESHPFTISSSPNNISASADGAVGSGGGGDEDEDGFALTVEGPYGAPPLFGVGQVSAAVLPLSHACPSQCARRCIPTGQLT
jgi:NAD(P)H-flavin reductase